MSDFEIVVPKGKDGPRKLRRSQPCAVPTNSFDEDYVDPVEEEKYYRQVSESNGFDVDTCPLPEGGIHPYFFQDKYDYPDYFGLAGRLGLHCYNLQNGTNLELVAINKFNSQMNGLYVKYITLEAIDTCNNNSPCNFQTCISKHVAPLDASLTVLTELCRFKVPSGPLVIPVGGERLWKDEAIDDFYKGKLPDWLTIDKLAASTDKGQFYELQDSDLQANQWLHLYSEFAFDLYWIGYGGKILKSLRPLDIKKVFIQTKESGEESPSMKLKANNAIFYMSFMANGDPSGMPVEYQAIVRQTMDGKPGHIRLDVDCLAYEAI